ncbi:DUF262 domain-containing protein [Gracilinema caldarium]|uniref:DUF262 domain-containing protein n=1 Tax=Gracilinema caldarium (strain ATCC 51460 / DSM 7334 / H1) TaxID=744872 RepID=F8F045_GRAC1|nr:DUF262 domain-containing protein [Gracilinema caldarium]AEJ18698.1 protein of unknown function DUF262 [Gracilinema caldarium DSM 7334]
MKTNLLDTKTLTFREIIGNGKKYEVPVYQRDYSWKEEHWEELWLDIEQMQMNSSEVHYMGSIVLQNKTDKTFTIIDGQQRFTTLSILVLACAKILSELNTNEDRERVNILRDTYLGNKDGISLHYTSKLQLNVNNNDFYQTYLLQLKEPLNKSKLNDSNKLMINAYNYFLNKLRQKEFSKNGISLYTFVDQIIGDKLLFIQITVDDELAAYTVFETLNARGLELTSTDLLKNYLFSIVKGETDIQQLQKKWKEIAETVGIKKLPQFIRYYLNSKQKLIRSERLFKEIRQTIKQQEEVFTFLDDLSNYADLYIALDDSENELWKDSPEIAKLIEEIALFNAEQHKSLLMAAYFSLTKEEFVKVLRIIRAIVFRYTVISSLNPNELEKQYNNVAVKITNREIDNASDIFRYLQPIYQNDEDFRYSFTTKEFDTRNSQQRKIVRYILASIENQKYNKNLSVIDVDATIEHILPENAEESWFLDFEQEDFESAVYRLGNLTLLENKMNAKDAANALFEKKKTVYERSQYEITKEIVSYDTWNMNDIRNRQKNLPILLLQYGKQDIE